MEDLLLKVIDGQSELMEKLAEFKKEYAGFLEEYAAFLKNYKEYASGWDATMRKHIGRL